MLGVTFTLEPQVSQLRGDVEGLKERDLDSDLLRAKFEAFEKTIRQELLGSDIEDENEDENGDENGNNRDPDEFQAGHATSLTAGSTGSLTPRAGRATINAPAGAGLLKRATIRQTALKKFLTIEEFNLHWHEIQDKIQQLSQRSHNEQKYGRIRSGLEKMENVLARLCLSRVGYAWWRWQVEVEEHRDLQDADRQQLARDIAKKVFPPFTRVVRNNYFQRWQQQCARIRDGIRWRSYVADIANYWYSRVRPNKREWFAKWRRIARIQTNIMNQNKVSASKDTSQLSG
jgi:hypothetical protein